MRDLFERVNMEVNRRLEEALRPQPGLPEPLREAMRYSLLAPGKRLRPVLVFLAAEATGHYLHQNAKLSSPDGVNPWPAACAVEMIHAYSLIHDDLPAMDDDDLRRGQPTCHKKFGEALAILAGDALQALAFETLGAGYPAPVAAPATVVLARASGMAGMVGGQADDLALEREDIDDSAGNIEQLEHVHARKTGALIRAALQLGVLSAHAEVAMTECGTELVPFASATEQVPFHIPQSVVAPELLERFDRYGKCIGLAFQIVDDLLDVEGTSQQTGKGVQKDEARGKLTYPRLLGVEASRRQAVDLGGQAREALAFLGPHGHSLDELVQYILDRDR